MGWLIIAEWLSRIVLVLLVLMSVWSISIIIERRRFFNLLSEPFQELRDKLRTGTLQIQNNTNSLSMRLLNEISRYKDTERVERAFVVFTTDERKHLEKGIAILGTLGSTTPFIGLFGTILGIIVSFGELSQGSGNTNTVMFSLAEALILTAVGLLVAIPAVIAYNYFSRKVRLVLAELTTLKDFYLVMRP